ncbi:MAG TPA: sigma-70 family RNA polymerase sigma factor [Terriglobales bacterium]|jgi:RNA polymerase sigma-70 factor (ECF subfamily)|nr:sigma-70 family RNA polymerase sigma factor [Terriglobales bacterium]
MSAFERLVDQLLPHLIKFLAFGKTIPEADAEELASDVLMTIHTKIGTFRHGGPAKLTTWIFEIAKNKAIDYHRASSPQEVELLPDTLQVRTTSDGRYAGRNRELLQWLSEHIHKLSQQDQWLLGWRAQGIPYSQIAEWLGITEGTARVRHKRATEKLLAVAPPSWLAAKEQPYHE